MKYNERVALETQLKKIQQMISECAHYSAHQVKAPLARIKGLSNLYKVENTCDNKDYLVQLISENADDLSRALHEFNQMLDDCLCKEKIKRHRSKNYQ